MHWVLRRPFSIDSNIQTVFSMLTDMYQGSTCHSSSMVYYLLFVDDDLWWMILLDMSLFVDDDIA